MTIAAFRIPKTIIVAGVVGAFLIDFYLVVTVSWIFHTATARTLFFWDASNLLGSAAVRGGFETELLGCFLHLIVSMVWAAFFVLVLARIPAIARHPIVWGIIAGVGVKFFMQYVIIPRGHAASPHYNWISLLNNLIAHTFFFGVPMLLIARRARMALRNAAVLPRAKGEGGLCMNRVNPSLRQDLLQAISQLAGHIRYSKKPWITGFMTAKWPYRTLLTGYCALATFRF